MKITNLKIHKLYGYINYDISFNDTINFLYGENGCGKTTVLNIITSIITGKIYYLFKYDFSSIELSYTDSEIIYVITVKMVNRNITLTISDSDIINQEISIQNNKFDDEDEECEYYFNKFPILHKLQNIFNYVFLPLNRNGNYLNDSKVFRRSKYLYRYDDYKNFENNYNINISTVNSLISRAINDMNMKLNDINERFNKDILKSFLDAENITDSDEIIKYLNEITNGEIDLEDVKKQYTDVLTSINLLDNQSENKIHDYFTALYRDINDFNARKENVLINLLFKLSELKKITDIISKAEENDRLKSKVMLPINNFKNTINLFFKGSFNEKQLFIYPNGTLHFRNRFGKRITLNDLSSGEKQIITFFAYLIFCLDDTKQSVYLVDEPELSLHLNWQRIFVKSIMDLNMDIQLIFATHAPEMIGRYRDYAIKLEPKIEEKGYE